MNNVRNVFFLGHVPAMFTAFVWGTTFVASKHVLSAGVSPLTLMTFRFAVAYLVLSIICSLVGKGHVSFIPFSWSIDELRLLLVGLCGGSLYFFMEYYALKNTSALNVGIITSTVPIVTTAILIVLRRARIWCLYILGSFLAFIGAVLIITNGRFDFSVYPLGDSLAILDTILWSLYTVFLSSLSQKYSPILISRRLFFYALVTILPFYFYSVDFSEVTLFLKADVLLPALYLGVVASALCVWLWNVSVKRIGALATNCYLYVMTIMPVIASAIFMPFELSVVNLAGSFLVLAGVIFAQRKTFV